MNLDNLTDGGIMTNIFSKLKRELYIAVMIKTDKEHFNRLKAKLCLLYPLMAIIFYGIFCLVYNGNMIEKNVIALIVTVIGIASAHLIRLITINLLESRNLSEFDLILATVLYDISEFRYNMNTTEDLRIFNERIYDHLNTMKDKIECENDTIIFWETSKMWNELHKQLKQVDNNE